MFFTSKMLNNAVCTNVYVNDCIVSICELQVNFISEFNRGEELHVKFTIRENNISSEIYVLMFM